MRNLYPDMTTDIICIFRVYGRDSFSSRCCPYRLLRLRFSTFSRIAFCGVRACLSNANSVVGIYVCFCGIPMGHRHGTSGKGHIVDEGSQFLKYYCLRSITYPKVFTEGFYQALFFHKSTKADVWHRVSKPSIHTPWFGIAKPGSLLICGNVNVKVSVEFKRYPHTRTVERIGTTWKKNWQSLHVPFFCSFLSQY